MKNLLPGSIIRNLFNSRKQKAANAASASNMQSAQNYFDALMNKYENEEISIDQFIDRIVWLKNTTKAAIEKVPSSGPALFGVLTLYIFFEKDLRDAKAIALKELEKANIDLGKIADAKKAIEISTKGLQDKANQIQKDVELVKSDLLFGMPRTVAYIVIGASVFMVAAIVVKILK